MKLGPIWQIGLVAFCPGWLDHRGTVFWLTALVLQMVLVRPWPGRLEVVSAMLIWALQRMMMVIQARTRFTSQLRMNDWAYAVKRESAVWSGLLGSLKCCFQLISEEGPCKGMSFLMAALMEQDAKWPVPTNWEPERIRRPTEAHWAHLLRR